MQAPDAVTVEVVHKRLRYDAGARGDLQAPVPKVSRIVKQNGCLRGCLFIFPTETSNSGQAPPRQTHLGQTSARTRPQEITKTNAT